MYACIISSISLFGEGTLYTKLGMVSIESVRSRFLNKVVRCNLLGPALKATVVAVLDDGSVEVHCSPLGFSCFSTFTNVNIAYVMFKLVEEETNLEA